MFVAEGKKGGPFYFNLTNGIMIIPITRRKMILMTKNFFRGKNVEAFWQIFFDFDLLSSPVIELDHKVEEVGFAEI